MSFYITPRRRVCIVYGCGLLVLATVFVAFPWFFDQGDAAGNIFLYALAGVCGIGGFFCFWRAYKVRSTETLTIIPQYAPANKQMRFLSRMRWINPIACLGLAVMTAWDIHQAEVGGHPASVIVPLDLIYNNCGFWPTVLSLPALSVILEVIFKRKLRQLRSQAIAQLAAQNAAAKKAPVPD